MSNQNLPKVAQIGCGYWGKNLARNYFELGSLVAVCDEQADRELVGNWNVPIRSLDEILNDKAISGVSIATPAETHFEIANRALDHSKNVFIEKPITLNEDEAAAICFKAKEKKLAVMVGHVIQYHPVFEKMKELVDRAKVGEVQYIYSNRKSMGKFRNTEDVMWSFAPHDISMIQSITRSEPDQLSAVGRTLVSDRLHDWNHLHMAFPNGVKAHIQTCWYHYQKEHKFVVVGTLGTLVFNDSETKWEKKLALYPHSIDKSGPVPLPQKGEREFIVVEQSEPLKNECRHFLDCITTGAEPKTSGNEGLQVLRTLKRADQFLHNF